MRKQPVNTNKQINKTNTWDVTHTFRKKLLAYYC